MSVGDEVIVWCWNGIEWVPAWCDYFTFTNPTTIVLPPENLDRFSFTADGWSTTTGAIPIPAEARPGTYLLLETIAFIEDDRSSENMTGQAFFSVVP